VQLGINPAPAYGDCERAALITPRASGWRNSLV